MRKTAGIVLMVFGACVAVFGIMYVSGQLNVNKATVIGLLSFVAVFIFLTGIEEVKK